MEYKCGNFSCLENQLKIIPFIDGQACVTQCPEQYLLFEKHCCIPTNVCRNLTMVEYENTCVKSCPSGYSTFGSSNQFCCPIAVMVVFTLTLVLMSCCLIFIFCYWTCSSKYIPQSKHFKKDAPKDDGQNRNEDEEQLINIADSDDKTDEEDVQPEITIPDGKTYHLFLAYHTEDEQFVIDLVDQLETKYKFKCCFSRRDFTGGIPIQKQIRDSMKTSIKTVFLLSPSFTCSDWCDYEVQTGSQLSVEKLADLVPVMYTECRIPESLAHLSYIDYCRGGKDLPDEIYKAFTYQGTESSTTETATVLRNYDLNGTLLTFIARRNFPSRWERWWMFPTLSGKQERDIRSGGMQPSLDELCLIRDEINTTFYMSYYGMLKWNSKPGTGAACLFYVFALIAFLLTGLLLREPLIAVLLLIYLALGFPVILIIQKLLKQLETFMTKVTEKLLHLQQPLAWMSLKVFVEKLHHSLALEHKFFLSIKIEKAPTLLLLRYDKEPCKEYLKGEIRKLLDDQRQLDEEEKKRMSEEGARQCIQNLMKDHYRRFFDWDSLPDCNEPRHLTRNEKKCLCQLVEDLNYINHWLKPDDKEEPVYIMA